MTLNAFRALSRTRAFLALALTACGGAEAAGGAPSSPASRAEKAAPEPQPRSVEEAQEQIARARLALDGSPSGAAEKADAPAPKAPSPQSSTPTESSVDRCGGPCRAIESMRRAVEALCRMAGDTDKRCVDARKTLS